MCMLVKCFCSGCLLAMSGRVSGLCFGDSNWWHHGDIRELLETIREWGKLPLPDLTPRGSSFVPQMATTPSPQLVKFVHS